MYSHSLLVEITPRHSYLVKSQHFTFLAVSKTDQRMMAFVVFIAALLVAVEGYQPYFEHVNFPMPNNSYIYSRDIAEFRDIVEVDDGGLKCRSDDIVDGYWKDPKDNMAQEGANGGNCLYYEKDIGQGIISLYRKRSCTDHRVGLWKCVIENSSGETKSLYIYIGNRRGPNPPGKCKL